MRPVALSTTSSVLSFSSLVRELAASLRKPLSSSIVPSLLSCSLRSRPICFFSFGVAPLYAIGRRFLTLGTLLALPAAGLFVYTHKKELYATSPLLQPWATKL